MAVRGGEQSRPSPSPLRCPRCAARLQYIEADVGQRPVVLRCAWSKDSCLSDCLADVQFDVGMHVRERQCGHAWYMHGTSMTIACSLWQPASTTTELSRAAAAFRRQAFFFSFQCASTRPRGAGTRAGPRLAKSSDGARAETRGRECVDDGR